MGRRTLRASVSRSQSRTGTAGLAASVSAVYGWPVLLAAVVCLMLADLATTVVGLHYGLSEVNPVVAAVERRFGVGGIAGLKLVAAATLVALPAATPDPESVFVASATGYGAVQLVAVLSNLLHLWLVVG